MNIAGYTGILKSRQNVNGIKIAIFTILKYPDSLDGVVFFLIIVKYTK